MVRPAAQLFPVRAVCFQCRDDPGDERHTHFQREKTEGVQGPRVLASAPSGGGCTGSKGLRTSSVLPPRAQGTGGQLASQLAGHWGPPLGALSRTRLVIFCGKDKLRIFQIFKSWFLFAYQFFLSLTHTFCYKQQGEARLHCQHCLKISVATHPSGFLPASALPLQGHTTQPGFLLLANGGSCASASFT